MDKIFNRHKIIFGLLLIFPAQVLFVAIFVASIVLLKDTLPFLFNDYAFMFFIVSALAAKGPNPAPFEWMAIEKKYKKINLGYSTRDLSFHFQTLDYCITNRQLLYE